MENRIIKFRAWDKYSDQWRYFDMNQILTPINGDLRNGLVTEGVQFYQFTGLQDRNGKDIYAQDILNIHAGNPYDAIDGDYKVIWRLSGWYIEPIDGSELTDVDNADLALHNYTQASEVIGNIYSNPELK